MKEERWRMRGIIQAGLDILMRRTGQRLVRILGSSDRFGCFLRKDALKLEIRD